MRVLPNLDRYPFDRPGTAASHALVADCRAQHASDGMFYLPGFLHPAVAAEAAAALLPRFATEAFRHEREHNIYFRDNAPGLAPDHPALVRFRTSNDTLCLDQIGDSPVAQLYGWPPFAAFLAAAMDKPALYPMADPLAGVNVMAYAEGQALNWHFDRSEFTTTLLLQAPAEGGEFIYRNDLRSDTDPNHDGVARLLRGEDPGVRTLTLAPGTLNVFRGKNTPHCGGDVRGPVRRMIAVFSFYDRPGVTFTEAERIGFYGRAA